MNGQDSRQIAGSMINLIRRKYSYLLLRQQEFDESREILESRAAEADTNQKLLRLGIEAFSRLRDSHIRIVDREGNMHSTFSPLLRQNYDASVTANYLSDAEQFGPIRLGRIGKIIYISIDSFYESERRHFDSLYHRDAPTEKKFIIDLRENGGGSDRLGKNLVSFLLGDQGPFMSCLLKYREDDEDPEKLSDFVPRYIDPAPNSTIKQVAVLTGRQTCSSAEHITLDLGAIPGAILIGDTTGGSTGCPKRYVVDGLEAGQQIQYNERPDASFALDIPSWLAYRPDKVLVQDNGIMPHIRIRSEDSIKDNRDLVLEKALEILD